MATAFNPWPRNGVHKVGPFEWFVPSQSRKGMLHTVTFTKDRTGAFWTCSCEFGQKHPRMTTRPVCHHVFRVRKEENDERVPPRPVAQPNVSALCD